MVFFDSISILQLGNYYDKNLHMQFTVIGLDGKDEWALGRRLAVREEHIKLWEELLASWNMWYWAAIWDDDKKMIGSILMYDFKDEAEFNAYMEKEPYVVWKVWEDIQIHKCNTRDPWQFNRPKEFFENRS